ncbi:hypothetical protein LSH36_97g02032 [Paralvinella palmiformis]|uniref:Uncharacterized protein n=1 Tax=Paralvinella palmiformis TaxID=53620 RepID=A0AAD9K065_9ANNE|nr:hypothetical protein LSH36_97g02032 [Paralvinella palmiformis]
MAEGQEQDEFLPFHLCEDLVCCVVCYEPFSEERTPKALPCLHSFCKSCLAACIMAHKKRSRPRNGDKKSMKGEFPCPVCKDNTKIPSNGLDGFRDDFRIRRILEILDKSRDLALNASTQNLEISVSEKQPENGSKCGLCSIQSLDSEADKYCLDCFKLLCDGCADDHKAMTLTSDHNVIELPIDVEDVRLPLSSTCRQHPSEPLRYYCTNCDDILCMSCSMTSVHKEHGMVRLSDRMADIKHDITSTMGEIWREVFDAERKLDEIDSLERELRAKEMSVKRAILSKTLEEIFRARQRQHKMEEGLEEICSRKLKLFESRREACRSFVERARSRCSVVECIVQHGQDLQIVHTARQFVPGIKAFCDAEQSSMALSENATDLGKYDTFLTELYEAKDRAGVDSQASILAEIRSVVSEMRQLSAKPTRRAGASPANDANVNDGNSSGGSSCGSSKTNLVAKIGRKGKEEGEFSFPSGITFLTSGELAVADMHNHRIQIFDCEGRFLRSFGGSSFKPCGLVATADGNLAVTDCFTGKSGIKVFTPGGELLKSLGEGFFEYPFSIAIDSTGRYVVCDSATNRIVMLTEGGELYRRFSTKTKFAFYLAITAAGSEILLSDWFNHCVKVFDTNGVLLRRIGTKGVQDGQLMIPLGLCTDGNGNVLILDCKCGRVSMFTLEGRFVRHVIGREEGIEYSRAIALSNHGRLAISSGDNRGNIPNEVRLYKI